MTGSLALNLCSHLPALAVYLLVQCGEAEEGEYPCTVYSKGQLGRGGRGQSRAPVLTPHFLARKLGRIPSLLHLWSVEKNKTK